MCGIAGILYKNQSEITSRADDDKILSLLRHRGPDHENTYSDEFAHLFHCRLQIVDTSGASNQPYRYPGADHTLVFNGEIFNYQTIGAGLNDLKTRGDTEVLYRLLAEHGKECLNRLNGFFAFAMYNEKTRNLLIARDRFGVKPLYYYEDHDKLAFASELKPLLALTGKQELNHDQLYTYLRLNYCAGRETIFKNIFRLMPGECIEANKSGTRRSTWYEAPKQAPESSINELLEDAVKIRLRADVPVGTFLSGGLDSSIISAIAKKHHADLHTFSIGFEDENYFDESDYSELVAKHIGSRHHVFKLRENDFTTHIDDFLNNIDEPFADSSAFNFYLLSKYTSQHVKVALSGDGADELFKGYNKHRALLVSGHRNSKLISAMMSALFSGTRSSRDSYIFNKIRQLKKFSDLAKLPEIEKHKFLASISSHAECAMLLHSGATSFYFDSLFKTSESLKNFELGDTFDIQTVLADDMLVKADRFSMQNGLEIRNPFLDYRIVELALNTTRKQKISYSEQKIILKENFAQLLPKEIVSRSKKGFELPLRKWLNGPLRQRVENEWLNATKTEEAGIFNHQRIRELLVKMDSADPGDSAAQVWALVVFENWRHNFKEYIL